MAQIDSFDVVIVGSGFGGAIPAEKLAKAGMKVCLLERGPWRTDNTNLIKNQLPSINFKPLPIGLNKLHFMFRGIHHSWLPNLFKRLNVSGLFEVFITKNINVMCSSSVGGGSHVYGGLHAKPLDENYWDTISKQLSSEIMNAHYNYVREKFNSKIAPKRESAIIFPEIDHLLSEIPISKQPYWAYQKSTTNDDWYQLSDIDSEGPFGSQNGQKTTLDRIFIAPAVKNYSLQVNDLCEVIQIEKKERKYNIYYHDHTNKDSRTIMADKVILAAGCINTVKLLKHSCNKSMLPKIKNLGKNFSANGDVMAFWPINNPLNQQGSSGPYKKLYKPKESPNKFIILQTGVFGLKDIPLPTFIKRWLNKQSCLASIGEDNANGEITLEKTTLNINYQERANNIYADIRIIFDELAKRTKTKIFSAKKLTTVHPMGGAIISDSPDEGVVNPWGEIYHSPGIFITDASVFPKALGSPPSWTIAAWASHVSDYIIQNRK